MLLTGIDENLIDEKKLNWIQKKITIIGIYTPSKMKR
jgi:hypothetical protein